MFTSKRIIPLVIFALLLLCFLSWAAHVYKNEDDEAAEGLISEFVQTTNSNNVEDYIELFTQWNQIEMRKYVSENGKESFSQEQIELKNIKKLSAEVGYRSAGITAEELSAYEDLAVFYVETQVAFTDEALYDISDEGYAYKVFVIVKEDGEWKIERVSVPDFDIIIASNEGLKNTNEIEMANTQNRLQKETLA